MKEWKNRRIEEWKGRFRPVVLAILFVVAVFFAYSFLPLTSPSEAASPDERANHFFATRYAESGRLWEIEPLHLVIEHDVVHPRSMRVVGDFTVPGGFIGLPVLLGLVGAAFGTWAIPFLTPFLALAGVAAWGMLVSFRFGRRAGMLAAVLLAAHPAWWYETGRTLFPNVAFLSLTLIAAWFFILAPLKTMLEQKRIEGFPLLRRADTALAGIAVGLAIAVRPPELYAFVVAGLVLAVVTAVESLGSRVEKGFSKPNPSTPRPLDPSTFRLFDFFTLIIAAALTLAPFLALNVSLYGGPFATGYGDALGNVPVADQFQGLGSRLLGPIGPYLFPLGFAPTTALRHFIRYGLVFFWWWSVIIGTSVFWLWKHRKEDLAKRDSQSALVKFMFVAVALVVWSALFYGSWTVHDNPDPSAVTIGSSYIRYWLPLFMLSTLPVAVMLASWRDTRKTVFALSIYVGLSAATVFFSPQEGFLAMAASILKGESEAREIIARTEDDAVIVTDRADKALFPRRRVIVPLRRDATFETLGRLRGRVPLYYFGITFPEGDLEFLNGEKLAPIGLVAEPIVTLGEQTLYRLKE